MFPEDVQLRGGLRRLHKRESGGNEVLAFRAGGGFGERTEVAVLSSMSFSKRMYTTNIDCVKHICTIFLLVQGSRTGPSWAFTESTLHKPYDSEDRCTDVPNCSLVKSLSERRSRLSNADPIPETLLFTCEDRESSTRTYERGFPALL
jgi:hypothetical protein